MTIDELKYPVLCFAKDGSLIRREAPFSASRHALDIRYFVNLSIVDSAGETYSVVSARPVQQRSLLAKIRQGLMGPRQLDLVIQHDRSIALIEFKALVIRYVENESEFWEEGHDLDELKAAIKEAQSYEAVMHCL